MITATFSVIQQIINLKSLPPLRMTHTSETIQGQIYIPLINWACESSTTLSLFTLSNLTWYNLSVRWNDRSRSHFQRFGKVDECLWVSRVLRDLHSCVAFSSNRLLLQLRCIDGHVRDYNLDHPPNSIRKAQAMDPRRRLVTCPSSTPLFANDIKS